MKKRFVADVCEQDYYYSKYYFFTATFSHEARYWILAIGWILELM